MLWDRFIRWLRIGAALWVGVIVVESALQASGLIPRLPKLEPYAWVISLVIIGVDSVGSLLANKVRRSRGLQKQRVEKALMGLMLQLSQRGVIRFEQVSASVYVPTRWSRFVRWALRKHPDEVVLARFHQFRPGGHPQQSGIRFTPSKGVVGECWRSRAFVTRDLHDLAQEWGGFAELTPAAYAAIPRETRQGFTRNDFLQVMGKYSEVSAEPIWHPRKDGKLIGVVAIDRPRLDKEDGAYQPRLGQRETREQLSAVAQYIGGILKPESD